MAFHSLSKAYAPLSHMAAACGEFLERTFRRPPSPRDVERADLFAARVQLHAVLANPLACVRLRALLEKRPGGENLEFLVAYWTFDQSRNGFQRFENFRHIIHTFVRQDAARAVRLSDACRTRLMAEWQAWCEQGRLPVEKRLRSLDTAAHETFRLARRSTFEPWLAPAAR